MASWVVLNQLYCQPRCDSNVGSDRGRSLIRQSIWRTDSRGIAFGLYFPKNCYLSDTAVAFLYSFSVKADERLLGPCFE